jgi:hypothetical protein
VRAILAVFFLLGDVAVSSQERQNSTHVRFSDRFAYIVDGVSFQVDPQAWYEF